MPKICIITPGTIASNPRVVKEAEALSAAGYGVHLIYTRHVANLLKTDQEVLDCHPEWTYDYIDWTGKGVISKVIKFVSGIKRRVAQLFLQKNIYTKSMTPLFINRFFIWQLWKAVTYKAELYIAHYPDSIAIAAKAARINNALFAYDAEDYHRGENLPPWKTKVISINEDIFLKEAAYISAASSLIANAYRKLYSEVLVFPIENMFSLKSQPPFKYIRNDHFKFFWFSQTIGPDRGLEQFIIIAGLCSALPIRLTLLGNIRDAYKRRLEELWKNEGLIECGLTFLNTVPENEIFEIASHHHFGLCLEIPSVPNKDFCMSNKLYTYILSGNILILSQTSAQNKFHEAFPKTGISIHLNKPQESAAQILKLLGEPENLNTKRQQNYELGQRNLNFDIEKELLLNKVADLWR